jgi:hypothetical protein
MTLQPEESGVDEEHKSLIIRAEALTKALVVGPSDTVERAESEDDALNTLDSMQQVRAFSRGWCRGLRMLKRREHVVVRCFRSCFVTTSDHNLLHDSAGRGHPEAAALLIHS